MTNSIVPADVRIMLVDDEPANLKLLSMMLGREGYCNLALVLDPREVVATYQQARTDLIMLDINMPHLDGYGVMEQLKALNDPLLPPIIVLTAQQGQDYLVRALSSGARDFVTKPFSRTEMLARVRNLLDAQMANRLMHDQKAVLEALVRERTEAVNETRLQIIRRLGRAAEYRDNETGFHVLRMSKTSALLARSLGWDDAACELMLHASPMHDVGKIGVPDAILLKPGKLDAQEWETMKSHVQIGADLLCDDGSELLTMARAIALTHHEKWDGSGYPNGLVGSEIPQAGRIVAVADVFDALTSVRPYKAAWPVEQAVAYLKDNAGKHFDPAVVEHFLARLPEILSIREQYAEPEAYEAPRVAAANG